MASIELGRLVPFPASEAEFPSFPEDIIPAHDYRLNLAAVAKYIQTFPASKIDELRDNRKLEALLDIHMGPLLGTLITFTAKHVLFNTYTDINDTGPTPQKCIPGPLTITATLRDYGLQSEVIATDDAWEPGIHTDFFLIFSACNSDTGDDGFMWVPYKALEAHTLLAFDDDTLN